MLYVLQRLYDLASWNRNEINLLEEACLYFLAPTRSCLSFTPLTLPENTAAFCLEHFDNFIWDFIIAPSYFVHRILYCRPDVIVNFFLVFHGPVLFLFFPQKVNSRGKVGIVMQCGLTDSIKKRPSRSILLILLLFFVTLCSFLGNSSWVWQLYEHLIRFKLNKTKLYVNIVNILSFR